MVFTLIVNYHANMALCIAKSNHPFPSHHVKKDGLLRNFGRKTGKPLLSKFRRGLLMGINFATLVFPRLLPEGRGQRKKRILKKLLRNFGRKTGKPLLSKLNAVSLIFFRCLRQFQNSLLSLSC
jgi:hypothetical protein